MLPKPTYTGFPVVQERLQLVRERASVGRSSAGLRDVDSALLLPRFQTWSAASHGRPVKTWSRTLSTGGRPIVAR